MIWLSLIHQVVRSFVSWPSHDSCFLRFNSDTSYVRTKSLAHGIRGQGSLDIFPDKQGERTSPAANDAQSLSPLSMSGKRTIDQVEMSSSSVSAKHPFAFNKV